MKDFILLLHLTVFVISGALAQAEQLPRRGDWRAAISYPDGKSPGVLIREIDANSPLARAGLQPNDRIVRYNDRLIQTAEDWDDINYAVRANVPIKLLIKRGLEFFTVETQLPELPRESYENIDVSYETITSDLGIRQRGLLSKPNNATGKLPAIFVVQGLSCSSVEVYSGRRLSGWTNTLRDLVTESGMVVLRLEKPGVGDSEGPACSACDFHTEMEGYRAALRWLKAHPAVDSTKVFIFGSSMGSALAPILANEIGVRGIVSDGVFVKTWFEHMLEIERRRLELTGHSPAEVMAKMNGYIELYEGMLVNKQSYAEVIAENPALAPLNYHTDRHMYGRPVEYYHQIQDVNFAKAWENIQVPVRIQRGSFDWIMTAEDNHMIIDILERSGHQDHRLKIVPGMDHNAHIFESQQQAFDDYWSGRYDPANTIQIITWFKEMLE